MTEPFRWTNCHADVATWRYGRIAQEFLDEVVLPSLRALDAQADKWSRSDDPVASFQLNDIEELRRATTMAFCLSIQSLWERQIRSYLRGCARELTKGSALAEKAIAGNWGDLDELFFTLRGIRLSSFNEYHHLDLLYLVGNVCRHGDGRSSEKLWQRCPEFWPNQPRRSRKSRNALKGKQGPPSIQIMDIPHDQLRTFVDAIVSFWDEVNYIYLESIERKHESVQRKLVKMREERARKDVRQTVTKEDKDRTL